MREFVAEPRITAIKLVSAIYLVWGLTILVVGQVPRPFGNLEPFLTYLNDYTLGVILTIVAASPLLAHLGWRHNDKVMIFAVIPQQIFVYWGVASGVWSYIEDGLSLRSWFGLCTVTVFAIFHSQEVTRIYARLLHGRL